MGGQGSDSVATQVAPGLSIELCDPGQVTCHQVLDIRQETKDVTSFVVDAGGTRLEFRPGQCVLASLEKGGEQSLYFLSSAPCESEFFELTVHRDSPLYEQVGQGDWLFVTRPLGGKSLSAKSTRPLCIIARDHSVICARSLFRELLLTGWRRRFTLLHEVTDPHQVVFDQEFRDRFLPGFCRYLFLDCEDACETWPGPTTRVTAEAIKEHIPDFQNTAFYLCGSESEVDYYSSQLNQLPLHSSQVFTQFW